MNRKEAIRLFIDASRAFPASVTAQGAYVALTCTRKGETTEALRDLYVHPDSGSMKEVMNAAKDRHRQGGVDAGEMTEGRVRGVIGVCQSIAKEMLNSKLTVQQLQEILKIYPRYHQRGVHEREGEYYNEVLFYYLRRPD
jgi:hypothetical protein